MLLSRLAPFVAWSILWPSSSHSLATDTDHVSPGLLPDSLQTTTSESLLAQYGSDVVLRFDVTGAAEAHEVVKAAEALFLDLWDVSSHRVDLRISNDTLPLLVSLLPSNIAQSYSQMMSGSDLVRAIQSTMTLSSSGQVGEGQGFSSQLGTSENDAFFREYRPLHVITPWMRLLRSMFPTHTRLISVGESFEGREILALRVGVHPTNDHVAEEPRKVIIVSGGSHAREWISTATVNFVAYSFIINYGKSPDVTKLIEEYDWVFIPTINPDGYTHTFEGDRLWRKNRQSTPLRFCKGIDLDRSWSYMWEGPAAGGNPCSETYAGEEPLQGIEALRLAEWARNQTEHNNVKIEGFVDLHSYSQEILVPYSYSCLESPPTLEVLEELGQGLARAIRRTHRKDFSVLRACRANMMNSDLGAQQSAGGSPLDWFYHEMDVRSAFQLKLRDSGSYGFLLPREFIVPSGEEIFNALVFLGQEMRGSAMVPSRHGSGTGAQVVLAPGR